MNYVSSSSEHTIIKVIERILQKRFPNVSLKNSQVVTLHELISETNEWVKTDQYCVYLIVENKLPNTLIEINDIENQLSNMIGHEICVSR
jgi:hypothetical protein